MVVLGALAPHPPIIVPAVGRGEIAKVAATREALAELARRVAEAEPETIVVFTPHGNVFRDGFAVTGARRLAGDLAQFGDEERREWENDLELAEEIAARAEADGIQAILLDEGEARLYRARTALDHGVLVPLSFLAPAVPRVRLVVAGMAFLPPEDLYRFGQSVRAAADRLGRRTVVVASGDLSHRLTPEAPAGYDPRGERFDRELVALLAAGDVPGVVRLDPTLAEKAGECGYRTILMMLGALDGQGLESRVLSYEGPFGVGYAVAFFRPTGPDPGREFAAQFARRREEEVRARRHHESPLVRLARETVEAYVRGQSPPKAEGLPPEAERAAGVFVSIKKHGELRGCIGTTVPTRPTVHEEIQANAVAAAVRDLRFDPVRPEELPDLVYSVDVLGPPEPVDGLHQLDPKRYGVIVRRGARQGLLLPDLEGIETAEEQVAIAKRKAGLGPDEEVQLERFTVVRYH